MAIPPLVLRIYADSSGVKKGVTQAQTQVGGLRASVVNNAALIQQAFAVAVVGGIALSIKAASDLNEAMNKSTVVFGESSKVVSSFADTSAESFGIAKAEAFEAAASFGAMFDSAGLMESEAARMSVAMSKLAADMGSFNNVPVVEMLEKLRSGLAGEAEPLRRFGVFISEARVEAEAFAMGMEQVNGKFTDAQKIQARYNIILKDTKKQQGDFGRTLGESLPNQMKVAKAQLTDLAASFGSVLLPVLVDTVSAVNDIIGPLISVIDQAKAFAAEHEEVGGSLDFVVEKLKESVPLYDEFRGVMDALKAPTMDMQVEFNRVGVAIGEVANKLSSISPTANAFRSVLARTGVAANRFTNMTQEAFTDWATTAGEQFNAVETAFTNLAEKAKVTAQQVIREFRRQADAIQDYRRNLETVQKRNIPDALLAQLVDMGTEGAVILAELANASDRKFNQMVKAMQRARAENQRLINDIQNLRDSAATPITFSVRFQQGDLPNPQQRASGGPVTAMRPYIVGEEGPELFVPGRSGTIVPNDQLPDAKTGVTIHIHGDVNDAEQFGQKVERALNRAMARAG
jgi:predicted DNA-binding protein YlxM (UPF0122 family)